MEKLSLESFGAAGLVISAAQEGYEALAKELEADIEASLTP